MRYLLIIAICFCANYIKAQTITYEKWKELARNQLNLQPEYGNGKRSSDQIATDKEFVELAIKQNGTAVKASEYMVSLGFKYVYSGDLQTAMKRFNQAWLLNPNNENAYWGFGSIYFMFGDFDETFKMYDKGLNLNPKSSNILTDKATVYLMLYQSNTSNQTYKTEGIKLLQQSYAVDSTNQNTLFKLSAYYLTIGDCNNALKYYNECKKLGGKPITATYDEAIKQNCSK